MSNFHFFVVGLFDGNIGFAEVQLEHLVLLSAVGVIVRKPRLVSQS